MPIEHAIWRVTAAPERLTPIALSDEKLLEDMIIAAPRLLSEEWMMIGRQARTVGGGFIDLLAVAPDGSLVLIEIKRDRTPRDVVAQALDYASWVRDLETEEILEIYSQFKPDGNLSNDFRFRFGIELNEDELNQSHQIIIVAASLDHATERIVKYLSESDVPINVLFFQVFQHGTEQLLSRAWLLDPVRTQGATSGRRTLKEPWNGEFYGSFGHGEVRSWLDAREHGFFSAGGGVWYTRTLKLLGAGDRIWVNVPRVGFVGVGRVLGEAIPAKESRWRRPTASARSSKSPSAPPTFVVRRTILRSANILSRSAGDKPSRYPKLSTSLASSATRTAFVGRRTRSGDPRSTDSRSAFRNTTTGLTVERPTWRVGMKWTGSSQNQGQGQSAPKSSLMAFHQVPPSCSRK